MRSLQIISLSTIFLSSLTGFSKPHFTRNNMELLKLSPVFSNAEFISLLQDTTIHVVAPASGVSNEQMLNLKHINSLKFDIPLNCFNEKKGLFHSNNDETRYKCLIDALLDESSKVIWSLRGGYGSAKLIPNLQKLKKPVKEKFFIGFSDITALHIFLTQEWGWKTIHGNGIAEIFNREKDPQNYIKIAKIIYGDQEKIATIKGLTDRTSHLA